MTSSRCCEDRDVGCSKQVISPRSHPAYNHHSPSVPWKPVTNSAMYQDETKRFARDAAAEEFQARQQKHQHQQDVYARRGYERYERDRNRTTADETREQRKEQRMDQARTTGAGDRRNNSGEPFDIVTLTYRNTAAGDALRDKDIKHQQRADARAINLQQHERIATHNIITGQLVAAPPPPVRQVSVAYNHFTAPWDR